MDQKQGLIAILDALGAAGYDDREISRFLNSRERVLKILGQKANAKEVRGDIDSTQRWWFKHYWNSLVGTLDACSWTMLCLSKTVPRSCSRP